MNRFIELISDKFETLIKSKDPIKVLAMGYVTYMSLGFLFLLFPFSSTESVSN